MISLNGHLIIPTMFPDQTSQVWNIPEDAISSSRPIIRWQFEHEAEIMHLAQLVDLLREGYGLDILTLHLPYLPYSRQDKEISNKMTFALHTFAMILNSLKFDTVIVHDPHSDEAKGLINNIDCRYPEAEILDAIVKTSPDVLFYPDEGALNKYTRFCKIPDIPFVYGEKSRNKVTGVIETYSIYNPCVDLMDKRVLIIDDICDGGSTFVGAAAMLTDCGASKIFLYVSHGIFSKGTEIIFNAGIERILTMSHGEIER